MKEKFIFTIFSQLISNFAIVISHYFLALYLEIELMGTWALLNSIINLGFIFINLGIDSIHFQYSGKKNFDSYFGSYLFIKLFLIFLNLVFSIFLIFIFQINNAIYLVMILFLCLSKILINLYNIFVINLKARLKIFKSEIPLFLAALFKGISVSLIAFNLNFVKSIINPLILISILNCIFDFLCFLNLIVISKFNIDFNKPKRRIILKYLRDAKPLMLNTIISIISVNIGNIILDYTFGETSLANFYIINSYIIHTLNFISGSIITLYLTYYSKLFESGNFKLIEKITHIVEKYSSIFFSMIIIIVFTLSDIIFYIFLPNYLDSIPILLILIFIPYAFGITRPYGLHMISGKKQKISASWESLNSIFAILLMILLIPNLGSIGYALALTIPIFLSIFVCRFFSNKFFKIKSQRVVIYHLIIAFLNIALLILIRQFLEFLHLNILYILLIITILGIFFFMGTLVIFRFSTIEDLNYLKSLLKFDSYKNSYLEE